jgi:hypothetical protein
MFKLVRTHYRFAIVGFAITVVHVVYQLVSDARSWPFPDAVVIASFIVCPPSLLAIPVIDAEIGTDAFYSLWTVIGLLNAVLYAAVGTMIAARRKKSA